MLRRTIFAAAVLFAATSSAQDGVDDYEWRTYGGDLASTRYAPLDQIDRSNFNELELAWVLALFTVGDVYASLCKKGAYAPFGAQRRSRALLWL